MMALHQSWGEKIRARRKALGLTQIDLAEALGIKQSTISRIESGQCPSDRLKFQIAGALRETVEHLFPYPPTIPALEEDVA